MFNPNRPININQKYYFVCFRYYRHEYDKWLQDTLLIDRHPLEFLIDKKKNILELEYQYQLISWQEITKEQFEKYKDEI